MTTNTIDTPLASHINHEDEMLKRFFIGLVNDETEWIADTILDDYFECDGSLHRDKDYGTVINNDGDYELFRQLEYYYDLCVTNLKDYPIHELFGFDEEEDLKYLIEQCKLKMEGYRLN